MGREGRAEEEEEGKREWGGELGGMEWSRWGKNRNGEQGGGYLDGENHYGTSRKPGTREIPKNPQERPQLRP